MRSLRPFVRLAVPFAALILGATALAGCDTETGGAGSGGSGGSATGGSGSGGSGGLSGALCKQGHIVIQGTIEGADVTLDLEKDAWGYVGPGDDLSLSFADGSMGLNPPANTTDDSGELPVTGAIDLPPSFPHGSDLLCADEATLVVCGGDGFEGCADSTYRFAFTITKLSVAKGTGCPGKPIEGQLAGCLLDTL